MKNRKAPVLLFGVGIVALGAISVINAMQTSNDPMQHQHEEEEAVSEHKVTEQERAQAAASALDKLPSKGGSSSSNGKKALLPDTPGSSMEMAKTPTILIEEYKSMAPKPNDASTATHWYDEESRSAKIASENARSRG